MRILTPYIVIHLCCFLFFSSLRSQEKKEEKPYSFVNIKEGLTQRAVSSIIQDQQGFIWMGTNGAGLHKFNGQDFISYAHEIDNPKSLNSSLIHSLFVDSGNRIWIGTEEGLNLYNRELNQFKTIDFYPKKEKTQRIKISTIIENKDATLLIGTHQHGLFKLDPITLKTDQILFEEPYVLINSLVKANNGDILLGTNEGLFEFKDANNSIRLYPIATMNGVKKIKKNIETILIDNEGALWIGTQNEGLVKVSISNDDNYTIDDFKITDKRILSMLNSPSGNVLCGTENDGLFVMRPDGKIIKNYRYDKFDTNSIKSNSIWSLFTDEQERIWMGYYNNGVGVYDELYDKFEDIESLPSNPNSLQSSSVTAIQKDSKGFLWIGMDGGGVDVYDPKEQKFTHLSDPNNTIASGLNNIDIQSVFIDSKENVWVGSWGAGIYYLEKGSKSFLNFNISNTNGTITSNRIMSFAEDSDGTIWIGSFVRGLHSYDPKTKKFKHYNTGSFEDLIINYSDVRRVFVDSFNDIWICGNLGIYKISKDDQGSFKIISLTDKMYESLGNSTSIHLFLTMFEDSQKNLWFGTNEDGLCKYIREKDSFVWYNKTNGLDKETISAIIETDEKKLWISGNKGLSELDMKTDSIINFTTSDGLLSNDFNISSVYKDKDGTLYFGNYKGVNYFKPGAILTNLNKPTVHFSDFKLFNNSVLPKVEDSPLERVISETRSIILNHQQSVFTLDFVAINYTCSEKNQYAYYLEGFDNTWNYVGSTRSATYTNLPYGDYIFKVKAANNDGIWNENPTTLDIKILPPWWYTRSAILSYLFLCFLLGFVVYKFINQRIKEKQLIKSERDKRIQEEALNEKKIQFFTNISHEFRTPLTLILNPLEDIISNKEINLSKSVKEKHKIIHKNTTRLTRLIDELMDFRRLQFDKISVKASQINAVGFVKEIVSYFEEEASQRNIILSVESDSEDLIIWADSSMLEKIIFNILSNAFKATPDNGAVTVEVYRCNNQVLFPLISEEKQFPAIEIRVGDTGSGIKKEEINSVFERFYQIKEMHKQYYGGTGIGLEVVRSFIDLHKGKIEVESKEGIGTKFKVFIPLNNTHFDTSQLILTQDEHLIQKEKLKPNEIGKISTDFETESEFKTNRNTLLIVEDNQELRNYLKEELKNDYVVIEAVNGKEGLEMANKIIPDIIISDIIMPEINGYEFCSYIKQDIKTSHIPLLMLTAKAMNDDWVKGIDSGADVYLLKPFDMKVLRSQLKQLVSSRQILFNKYFNDISKVNLSQHTTSLDKEFILNVLQYINKNISDPDLNVENIAEELFLSRSQLYRKIKALTGETANEFLRKIRLERAKQIIENSDESISEISYKVGFSSPSYFSKCFKSHFGVLPTELK